MIHPFHPGTLSTLHFHVEMLFSLEEFSRIITPMLGGDRFLIIFLMHFSRSSSWFSETARLGPQKPLFCKVFILKCCSRSRFLVEISLPCSVGIVFFDDFWFRVLRPLSLKKLQDKVVNRKRCRKRSRKRNRSSIKTAKLKSVRS